MPKPLLWDTPMLCVCEGVWAVGCAWDVSKRTHTVRKPNAADGLLSHSLPLHADNVTAFLEVGVDE